MALALVTDPSPVARRPPGTRRSALRPLSQERQLRLEIERMKEEEAMRDKEGPVCGEGIALQPGRLGCHR